VSVPLTLLGLLERQPSHGYDLKRDYDTYFARGKPLSFGQVYTTLARLARDGKAVAGPPEPGDGPERKRYAITEAGTAEVDVWLSRPAEPQPYLQPELFAKVVLALMLGRPADRYLDAQRGRARAPDARAEPAQGRWRPGRHHARRLRAVPLGG
jgi:DNA-binding PadR family transcriptional regulator